MFKVDGVDYYTTSEAARQLNVAAQTLRSYLRDGRLPEVAMQRVGTRDQRGFTSAWIVDARAILLRPREDATEDQHGR